MTRNLYPPTPTPGPKRPEPTDPRPLILGCIAGVLVFLTVWCLGASWWGALVPALLLGYCVKRFAERHPGAPQ